MEHLKVLITVKTYPIPSAKYGELVCTAGVTEEGDFIRLYPVNLRDQPYSRQYKKYQWIEVDAERHKGRDVRKESYRPDCETLRLLGEPIPTRKGNWCDRARYVLLKKNRSMEELYDKQRFDNTSLGILRPQRILDLVVSPDDTEWKGSFLEEMRQAKLWDDRTVTKQPPRKVPFKFHYRFRCEDKRCNGKHRMMIEGWEVGALFWRLIDQGADPQSAAQTVREKFLDELCGPTKDTHFFVGTILSHPTSWVIIGVFWPELDPQSKLFE